MVDFEPLARRWFDEIHAGDFEAVASLYAPDCDYIRSDGASHGREACVEYLKGIVSTFPDHAARIDGVVADEAGVAVEWTETGTHTVAREDPILGAIPPTGQSFEAKVIDVFRYEGGLIVSQHEYYDLLSILVQLGWFGRFATLMAPTA